MGGECGLPYRSRYNTFHVAEVEVSGGCAGIIHREAGGYESVLGPLTGGGLVAIIGVGIGNLVLAAVEVFRRGV